MKNVEPFLMKVHQIEREKNKSGKRVLFITGLVFYIHSKCRAHAKNSRMASDRTSKVVGKKIVLIPERS